MLTKNIAALLHLRRRQHPPTLWIKHEAKQYMIRWDVVFNNPFAGGAKAASAQRTLLLSRQSAIVFGCVAIIARQKIRPILAKTKACFCKNRPYFLTGRWAAAWAKFCSTCFSVPHNVPAWLRHRKPLDRNTTERRLLTKWAVSTPVSEH